MAHDDPYTLDASHILAPPNTLTGKLQYLGPGFILSASIVGSGELIATTSLGAKAGFVTLWVVLLSCFVKVAIQLEFGRHTIQTGETVMQSFNKLPGPRIAGTNWSVWSWLLLQITKILQVGGIIGTVAVVMHLAFPRLFGFEVQIANWCWIIAGFVAMLVSLERYGMIERLSLILTVSFTLLTLVSVALLQWTPHAVTWSQIAGGLTLKLPSEVVVFAAGAFGLTGVGGDEIMYYNYWLLEKGYAAYAGPRDENDPAWAERANGWIKVMYLDALLSMVVYTLVTAAFYVLGAAVLHARGDVPEGTALVATLSQIYTSTLGGWANGVFLLGAFVVLFSTLFAALASWTRIYADTFDCVGWIDASQPGVRGRMIAILAWVFPVMWTLVYLFYKKPVLMVIVGGVGTSVLLWIVVFAALHFRYRRASTELHTGMMYQLAFLLSVIAILAVSVYGIMKQYGEFQDKRSGAAVMHPIAPSVGVRHARSDDQAVDPGPNRRIDATPPLLALDTTTCRYRWLTDRCAVDHPTCYRARERRRFF